jgi:hypothetical protein
MITKHDVKDAIIDALERVCENTQEYYVLNHLPPERNAELEQFLAAWLQKLGID